MAPPQLYAVRAAAAPIAVVFAHRGAWFQISRWDLAANTVERGAWFRGRIYQRRCDVSPDGTWLYAFAMKGGKPYHAISRVPWLTALALWHDTTTYGSGSHFEVARPKSPERVADEGTISPLAKKHRLELVPNVAAAYGAERRRGWRDHAEAPAVAPKDWFHEQRHQWLVCDRPGGKSRLELRDQGHTSGHFEGRAPKYTLDGEPLVDVTWADWDARGRLLVATRAGSLEIRNAKNEITWTESLAEFEPDPQPPPERARHW